MTVTPPAAPVPTPPPPDSGSQGYAKAIVASMAGAIVTLVTVVWNQYAPHPLPAEAVAALQTLVTGGAVLLTPHDMFQAKSK